LIHREWVEKSGLGVLLKDYPKTYHGYRTISLSPECLDMLRAHRTRQAQRRADAGDRWHDEGWIFTTRDGQRVGPNNVNHTFRKMLVRAGLPGNLTHPHGLRHFMATQWIAGGEPLPVVSERLGHASRDLTMRVYAHAISNMQAAGAARMGARLFRSAESPASADLSPIRHLEPSANEMQADSSSAHGKPETVAINGVQPTPGHPGIPEKTPQS
jgi:integrase